jgi:simple sugar transport system substrate-binding protein
VRQPLLVVGLVATTTLLLSACVGTGQESPAATENPELAYAVITHGGPGDAFWDSVKSGAETAGEDYGVTVTYGADPDPARQSQLIDNAVAQEVDGIVVSMANPDGLEASIEKAVAAGVPVVTINSGIERSAEFGALTHIGQSETTAGAAAGARLTEAGATNVLCVVHEAGNLGHEERCASAAASFGGTMANLQVDGGNDAEVKATIKARVQADPSIDGVLTLGSQYAIDAVGAVAESGSDARVATFDLSDDVVRDIEDGTILFAVDQQPYVQGFLGITALDLYSTRGSVIGGGQPVASGPAFVTRENAAEVAASAGYADAAGSRR